MSHEAQPLVASMTPQRLTEIEQLARLYGPSNGWTGTAGTLAGVILELLTAYRADAAELDRLRAELAASEAAREAAERERDEAKEEAAFFRREVSFQAERLMPEIQGLTDQLATVTAERNEARGAMAAQDRRERAAGEACGVPYEHHGCDWPDAVAEQLAARDAELSAAKQRVERLEPYARQCLVALMRDISEDHWAAGWMSGHAENLWAIVVGERPPSYGMGEVSPKTIEDLRQLSEDAGGWWTYERFIPMDEWLRLYAEHKQESEPT